mmetsp:Transcript_39544/g.99691  ORF Transcript_39544/g.99691 Transcript_39544/m.99691 type:complete len:322 (-) Transcript_39544:1907-2872(-)
MVFVTRYSFRASCPRSLPNPLCRNPPKGAATSVLLYVLTKHVPAWIFSATYSALLISRVNTPDASPNSVALARRTTKSTSPWKREMIMMGPNDSSRATNMSSFTSVKMVGSKNRPGRSACLPPSTRRAPSSTPFLQYCTSFSRCARWFCGPCAVPLSSGSPIVIFRTSSTTMATNSSWMLFSTNTRPAAMQFSPLLKNTPPIACFTERSKSESAKMINGLLPPSSRDTFFTLPAQDAMMCFPTSVEPVKPSLRTSGWSAMACPHTDPEPGRMFTTPGGMPAFTVSSANFSAVNGDTCAGFMTHVLPAARHAAIFHESIIRG